MGDPKNWKVISSKYLSRQPWFTVRSECVELPNGNRIPSYYVLEYPDWVNTIAITRDDRFVFVRQYRHAIGQVCLELSAGVSETSDPSPLASAQRELLEETGYGNGQWSRLMAISANPATHTNTTHCFLATGVEKLSEPALDNTEDLSVELLNFEEVRLMLHSDGMRQALMAAPLWRYVAERICK